MLTDSQREQFQTEGYFITDDAVDPEMRARLNGACERAREKVRSGEVDVFTHRTGDDGEPWAIRGLLAPEFDEPDFAEYLLSQPIMQYVKPFLGSDLKLGAVLIFTNPEDDDYGFGWHRDFGQKNRDGTEEEELAILNEPMTSLKWHLALADDSCLMIVPGSQKRYRTEHERESLLNNRHEDIPGQMRIELKAGQTAFWSGHTIHRGIMKKDIYRLTLCGSMSKFCPDEEPKEVDVQLKWRLAEEVRDVLPEEMLPLYDRWRSIQIEPEAVTA